MSTVLYENRNHFRGLLPIKIRTDETGVFETGLVILFSITFINTLLNNYQIHLLYKIMSSKRVKKKDFKSLVLNHTY